MTWQHELSIGDRLSYLDADEKFAYIVEVVSLEEKGAVCDLLKLTPSHQWGNIGHRSLLPYERLTRI